MAGRTEQETVAYGSSSGSLDSLQAGAEAERAAREELIHNEDPDGASCRLCGYRRLPLPSWVTYGTRFVLRGVTYRVVSIACTNQDTTQDRRHFRDYVTVQPITEEAWSLPSLPATKQDVGASLGALFKLPRFGAVDLQEAIHLVESP